MSIAFITAESFTEKRQVVLVGLLELLVVSLLGVV
jgi:hypothetical protein